MNKPVIVSDETLTEPVIVEPTSSLKASAAGPAYIVLASISFSHFLNDTMQSLVPALYPMWKSAYGLSFAQIGLISLVTQVTSSLLQPAVGLFSDHRPQPYSLAVGMGATLIGLLLLASVVSGFGGMWGVFACVFIYVSAQGFVFPNGSAIAMMRHGQIAGTASALLGTNQFLIAALATTFLGFIDNPALPMALVIAGSAVASTLLNYLTLGPRLETAPQTA